MVTRRQGLYILFFFFLLIGNLAYGQDESPISESMMRPEPRVVEDTVPEIHLTDEDLGRIVDLRTQFERQNATYAKPVAPSSNLLRFLKKDELEISPEAMCWARLVRDASTIFDETMTFRDTMIVNPIFMPIVFKGHYLPEDLTFYDLSCLLEKNPYEGLYPVDTTLFEDIRQDQRLEEVAYRYVQDNYPAYFRYSSRDLRHEIIKPKAIRRNIFEDLPLKVENDANFEDVDAPARFIPERRYWTSSFESTLQVAEAYVSKNWSGGGNPNLNLLTRQYLRYDYKKDKIQVTNEMEININLNAIPNSVDSIHRYQVNNDVFRIHSNFGYQAFNKWYYSFNFEFLTQLVNNYKANDTTTLAAFLAPLKVNLGLGMRYDLEKTNFTNKHKNLKLSVNIAPLSFNYWYSRLKGPDMDLNRHGFEAKENPIEGENAYKNVYAKFGSQVDASLTFNINRYTSWTSMFKYFTTYKTVLMEFENTLNLQITRFFSTRIYFKARFDDSVVRTEDFKSYFQFNQLMSFGFNYKW